MFVDLFNDDWQDWFKNNNKKPEDAKIVKEEVVETNEYKMIIKYWEGSNYSSIETEYVYNEEAVPHKETIEELQQQLQIAISNEEYELAAELRDKIKIIKSGG